MVGDRIAGFAQLARQQSRSLLLVVGELGMSMKALVGVDEVGHFASHERGEIRGPGRDGQERGDQEG
jgi:hypothetical protein